MENLEYFKQIIFKVGKIKEKNRDIYFGKISDDNMEKYRKKMKEVESEHYRAVWWGEVPNIIPAYVEQKRVLRRLFELEDHVKEYHELMKILLPMASKSTDMLKTLLISEDDMKKQAKILKHWMKMMKEDEDDEPYLVYYGGEIPDDHFFKAIGEIVKIKGEDWMVDFIDYLFDNGFRRGFIYACVIKFTPWNIDRHFKETTLYNHSRQPADHFEHWMECLFDYGADVYRDESAIWDHLKWKVDRRKDKFYRMLLLPPELVDMVLEYFYSKEPEVCSWKN